MSKKILITGADGFIGSHLTELLLENKFEVKAFFVFIIPMVVGVGLILFQIKSRIISKFS